MTKLNRRTALTALGGALAMPYVQPAWAQSRRVNVYNWADYIGETTLEDFEAATGITPIYDTYSSAEEMEAKMLAGSTGYDVAFSAGISSPRFIQAGVYQELDKSRLSGWSNLNPEILRIMNGWDDGSKYGVPYMWGTVGFTFNMDLVRERLPEADLTSMDILFDPANAAALADCGISILDSPTDIMLMVLRYLGIDGDTTNVADYDKVVEAFRPIRQYIRTFDNANYINAIPNGELCMVNNWSGDYATSRWRAEEAGIEIDLAYFVPKTGAPAWIDVMSIPADAPNMDEAYEFINFMLQPEVAAGCVNYVNYASANLAANPFIEDYIINDPAVYPDAETLSRVWAPKPFSEEQDRAMTRAWQQIKTG